MSGKPIGPFVQARSRSVADQLAGKPVQVPAATERRGGGFDPGRDIARSLAHSADSDNDGAVSQAELSSLFEKWFADWDADKSGVLSAEELRAGLGKSFMPPARRRTFRHASHSTSLLAPDPMSPALESREHSQQISEIKFTVSRDISSASAIGPPRA